MKVQGSDQAWWLQDELSRVHSERIVPLIEMCCSEVSEAGRIDRIESLVVDIGYVDPSRLEEEIVIKLLPAMRQALADQIREQENEADFRSPAPGVASYLELFAFFARTGSLPWWADTTRPHLLEETLRQLVHASPGHLRELMRDLTSESRSIRRIVYQYSSESLATLSGLLAPSLADAHTNLSHVIIAMSQDTELASGRAARQMGHAIWQSVLHVAGRGRGQTANAVQFYQEVLAQAAAELGVSYTSLVLRMARAAEEAESGATSRLARVLQTLRKALPRPIPSFVDGDLPRDKPLKTSQTVQERPWSELLAIFDRIPSPYREPVIAALRELERSVFTGGSATRYDLAQVIETILGILSRVKPPSNVVRDMLSAVQDLATAADLPSEEIAGLIAPLREALVEPSFAVSGTEALAPAEESVEGDVPVHQTAMTRITNVRSDSMVEAEHIPVDLSFSDTDRIYIQNSGLVILWPFIERFFERLGQMEANRFKDTAAAHRAVGLLQYIATGEESFPEYLLPLNKVLCGLELTEVFDFGLPITESEAEEGTNLLSAVIQHASVLRDMSVPSFRTGFLLREGVLSTRDGAWLLQVERKTYDIVMDLFPWSMQWLRLPWMEAPLRVEW